MRWWWLVGLGLATGVASGDDIYTWTDKGGGKHFSNVPSTDQRGAKLGTAETVPADEMPPADAGPQLTEEQQKYSNQAGVARSRMQREMRAMDQQMKSIDAKLAELARARTAHAGGMAITGGVGTNAGDFRTPEELALEDQKEELQKRQVQAREGAQKLRADVDEKLGGTPSWWIDPK